MENSEPKAVPTSTPGQLLRKAREELGFSQREMADRLNWMPSYVGALEENRFEVLRGPVFVRGYLRAYGRLVNVPEQVLLDAYSAIEPQNTAEESAPRRVETRIPQVQKSGLALPISVVVVLLVIAALWFWQGSDSDSALESAASASAASGITAVELGQVTESDQASLPEQNTVTQASLAEGDPAGLDSQGGESATASEVSAINLDSADAVPQTRTETLDASADGPGDAVMREPSDTALEAANLAGDDAGLVFGFDGECWVEVRDSDGELIFADLRRAGDVLSLNGSAPFDVLLGDARYVALRYQGEIVEFAPEPGRSTARFKVPQS
jgi:cytoskeleton protein RodZ